MAKGFLKGISIKGVACAVPNKRKINEDWVKKFGIESVKEFIKMTGVSSVYHSHKQQTPASHQFH